MRNVYFILFNFLVLNLIPGFTKVFAVSVEDNSHSNDQLKLVVGKEIKEVLDVWIGIGAAAMILVIIAGAGIMVVSGTNNQLRTAGKATVLGAGITITLLLSTYVIVQLFLSMFGLSLF